MAVAVNGGSGGIKSNDAIALAAMASLADGGGGDGGCRTQLSSDG